MKKALFTIIFSLALHVVTAFAAEYYCDLTLSGDGSGTTGDPWQWSQAINSGNVSAGDTVYLRGTGGGVTINTASNANGSTGSPIIYKQWTGQTQAQFTSVLFTGASAPYYELNGIKIDAGTGTTWVTAVSETLTGTGGEITIDGCTLYGFRPTTYSGGDYYPYYIIQSNPAASDLYNTTFTDLSEVTLTIKNNTFMHGYRALNLAVVSDGTTLIEGNTFNRVAEDFIVIGDAADGLTIRGNNFAVTYPASRMYGKIFWDGTATGTWSGHEGETMTQDTTGATAYYVGQAGGNIYMVANDADHEPLVTQDYTWRLDSDPSNIYFTVGTSGDWAHNDHIQFEGGIEALVEGNYSQGISPQALGYSFKVGDGDTTAADAVDITYQNNIVSYDTPAGAYCVQLNNPYGTMRVYNNILINKLDTIYGVRGSAGTVYLANNIISGGSSLGATVTAANNVWIGSDPFSGSSSLTNQDLSDSPSGNNRYFTGYATGDYTTYNADSPQVDAGSATYAPSDDYLGNSRPVGTYDDIGAYEYDAGGSSSMSVGAGSTSNISTGSTLTWGSAN